MSRPGPALLTLALLTLTLGVGCAKGSTTANRLGLDEAQVGAILDFLNDCGTDLELLDEDVGLDSDAAEALIVHRDGPDGACGTGDDDAYEDLDEVDAVPQVGDASILSVLQWLESGDSGDGGGTWEGVDFTAAEVGATLELANTASFDTLDVDVGLDSDSAQSVVDNRPFEDMDALADAPQIGAAALQALRDYAGG
ncbi:MAG: hypothetical protein H6741_25315 [Alphaproteobacteria bacterium]|nr:hypothetical protein [Alphaproteobacteria bacterium]